MADTYSEFKTYLTTFIWRQNDTVLANNMDNLIRMANAELNRKLNIQRREVAVLIAPETEDYELPADFYQMVSLSNQEVTRQRRRGEMSLSTLSNIFDVRTRTNSLYIEPFYYPQRGESTSTLYLVGPFSAAHPGSFYLTYRTAVPDYQTTDASWVEDEYLDLYVYTVLKHVAMFLREDERVQLYSGYMTDALTSAIDEDNHEVKYGGSPLRMSTHRHVPQRRRK